MNSRTKKRLIFLGVTLVVIGGAGVGAVSLRRMQRDRSLDQSLTVGMAAYEAKDYPLALDKLGYYVGRRPNDGRAILALAKARWQIPTDNGEHLTSAARYAQAASKELPTDPAPLEMLLAVYQEMGYQTERIEAAERLLSLDPKHLGALRARAECHILKNAKQLAEASATAWASAAPDSTDAHAAVIQAKRLSERSTEDIGAYLNQVVATHANDFRFAVFQAAMTLDVLNDRPAGIQATKRALAMPPADARSIATLVLILDNYMLDVDDKSLVGSADKFLAATPPDPVLAAHIAAIGAKRDFKVLLPIRSQQWIAPIVAAGENAPDAALGIAVFLSRVDQGFVVPSPLNERIQKRGTSEAMAWQHILRAQEFLTTGEAAEARRELIKSVAIDPSNDITLYLLAQADAKLGEWRRASASLNSLAASDPSWAIAKRAHVVLLMQAGQYYDALAQANSAYQSRKRLGEAYLVAEASVRVAEVSSDVTSVERAETFVNALISDPSYTKGSFLTALLARLHVRAGKIPSALEKTAEVLSSSTVLPSEGLISLADAVRPHDAKLASSLIDRARQQEPQNPDVALAAAEGLAVADPAAAERILTTLADSQSGSAKQATLRRIAAFLDRRADPRAIEQLRAIAADNPKDPSAQTLLLNSIVAWKDEPTISAAIKRYRDISGEDSTLWRMYEARRLMLFKPAADYASRAVQLLVPVVNAETTNAPALALLAEANRVLGDPSKPIEYLTRAVDANPADPTFYPALIDTLDRAGRQVESDRRLDTLASLIITDPDLLRQRAQLLAAHERWADAAVDFGTIARQTGSANDRLPLAQMLARSGKPEQAATIFDELVGVPAPSAPALVAAADFAASQGQVDKGAALLARLPADVPVSDRLAAQAIYLDRNGRGDAAEQLYEQAAQPGDPERVADLAMFYLRHSKSERAAQITADAIKKHPDNKRLLALANIARVRQGGQLVPGSLGVTLASLMTDEDPKAMEQWLAAIALLEATPPNRERYSAEIGAITRSYPKFYPGWHTLAVSSLETGDADGAIRAARGALAALPENPRAARLASEVFAATNRLDDAASAAMLWQRLTLADPFEADMELARIRLMQNRFDEAATTAKIWKDRAIAESDRLPVPLETYASTLVATGEVGPARDLLLAKAKESREWLIAFMRVASQIQNNAPAQRAWATDAAALRPDAGGQLTLGTFWHDLAGRTGSPDDLAQAISTLSAIKSEDIQVRRDSALLLASCYQARNQIPEALQEYRRVISFSPGDPLALNNLAYLLLTSGGSIDEAAAFAQKAFAESEQQRFPSSFQASTLDTLGLIQLRQKRGSDARSTYERAIKLSPNDISLWVGLAEAQVINAQLEEAKGSMAKVNTLQSQFPSTDVALLARITALLDRLGMPSSKSAG